jgi:hypothetical protein
MAEGAPAGDQEKKKPDVRIYLEEKIFPILTSGLEELLRAVEEREKDLKDSEEEDIPEVQPLLFLARYLMRNAPQTSELNAQRNVRRIRSGRQQAEEAKPADASPEAPQDA